MHGQRLAADAITGILDVVQRLADHARHVDQDMTLRRQLAAAQAHDKVTTTLWSTRLRVALELSLLSLCNCASAHSFS